MMTASYLRPRRSSRSTNLPQSSTIQRMGASASPEGGAWTRKEVPERWTARYKDLTFNVKPPKCK